LLYLFFSSVSQRSIQVVCRDLECLLSLENKDIDTVIAKYSYSIRRYVIIVYNVESKDLPRLNKKGVLCGVLQVSCPRILRFLHTVFASVRATLNEISSARLRQIAESTLNHASKLMLHRAENYKWSNWTLRN